MSKDWQPNQEYLDTLLSMGISQDKATQALFCTDNSSVDEAVNYIFNSEDGNPAEEDEAVTIPFKMVCVVNHSLKMGVGKIAAQVGHACVGLYRQMMPAHADQLDHWSYYGEKKIILKGNDEAHLRELIDKAEIRNIPYYLVRDAGFTQIAPGSVTVLSLFGPDDVLNEITGELSLL